MKILNHLELTFYQDRKTAR